MKALKAICGVVWDVENKGEVQILGVRTYLKERIEGWRVKVCLLVP